MRQDKDGGVVPHLVYYGWQARCPAMQHFAKCIFPIMSKGGLEADSQS